MLDCSIFYIYSESSESTGSLNISSLKYSYSAIDTS